MALWTRVVLIWTWCARGRTRGDSPQSAGLGKLDAFPWGPATGRCGDTHK